MAFNDELLTIRDFAKAEKPDGTYDRDIVNAMYEENPVLADIPLKECSNGREDFTTILTGMPSATWRTYYQGLQPSKSARKQVVNTCGRIGTLIQMDAQMRKDIKNGDLYFIDEVKHHAEAMGQMFANALFYGDIADEPKGINGLFKTYGHFGKYWGRTAPDDKVGYYVIDGSYRVSSSATPPAGYGAVSGLEAANGALYVPNTLDPQFRSIFLAGWGRATMHGLYPQGVPSGLQKGAYTEQYMDDLSGKGTQYLAGLQEMNWHVGCNVRDFRYGGRVCNININDRPHNPVTEPGAPDFVKILTDLATRAKGNGVKRVWYMPRRVWELVATQFYLMTRGNAISYGDLTQNVAPSLMGIPVAFCDAMDINEKYVPEADY